MIRTARLFFLSRALREKLLLVSFIAIGALWWASAYTTRASGFWRAQRLTTLQLREQAEWIKNKDRIEQTARKTADSLVPARTLDGNRLVTTVTQMATEAGVKGIQTTGPTNTTTSGQFSLHSQEFTIRNVEWDPLKVFYEALEKRSPYIAIERFDLRAPPNNSSLHTLSLRVTSVEIVR